MSDSTVQRLIVLAAKRFDKQADTLKPSDDFFEALGVDSLQALDLLTDLEEEFDVEIPDYELQDMNTFRQLADVIQRRL
jgi:acyl carrier protein